jgi:ABC-type glycerol-3-phosphate transport system substrate-binding protein
MKNLFKFGFLALAVSLSVAACNSESTDSGADTTLTDSSMIVTDTNAIDTNITDSTVSDTTVKVETTTTETAH